MMTETEWLAATDPTPMLEFLRGRCSDRKLRLFAVACCRLARHTLAPEASAAVDVAEKVAEGNAGADERRQSMASFLRWGPSKKEVCGALSRRAWDAAVLTARRSKVRTGRAEALRDLIGNPFAPPVTDPTWFSSDVRALAAGIYEEQAFDRMPILADALQDAGCDNEDVLNHCRQPGEHIRGCWVLDLILGKD